MGSATPQNLVEVLESICNVDVDAVDPRVATALPFKPHNQTSNQVICCDTMLLPEYRGMFLSKVKEYGSQGWEEVFNRVVRCSPKDRKARVDSIPDRTVLREQSQEHYRSRSGPGLTIPSV